MTVPVFQLSGVSYRYDGGMIALDGIDLAIRAGETLVVMGANGSGKSTLLKLLDGLIFAGQGQVSAFGWPLVEERLETADFRRLFRSRVGFLFQNPEAQLFSPTVFEDLAFAPRQLGLSEPEVRYRVEELLVWLGISRLRERSPNQLSGGEKKKVALAGMLAMNPEVLLLDEPTASLDPRNRRWLIELVGEFQLMGKTVIAASHDLAFAEQVATMAAVIGEDHRLAAAGSVAEILADRALLRNANLL